MAKARAADFDLATELAKPSFTPAQKDSPALVALVIEGKEPAGGRAAIALGKMGQAARLAVLERLDATQPLDDGARVRLIAVLGHLARLGDPPARARLLGCLESPLVRVRRAAIGALAKLGGDDARAAVIARWDATDVPPDERRTLADALGKLGGDRAIARLAQAADTDDGELARRRDRGLLMAERDATRGAPSEIRTDVPPPYPLSVRLGCKPGLAGLLGEELTAIGIQWRAAGDREDAVIVALAKPWDTLFASRLWATAAIERPFTWSGQGLTSEDAPRRDSRPRLVDRPDRVEDPAALASAIARAITNPETQELLRAWTAGALRWRLGFARGHKRAIVWRVAKDVAAAAPTLINDPSESTWEFSVDEIAGTLELVPKRAADPRFAWRVAEVPAASHPAVAAALAYVAQLGPADRVWDPFCGSGLELVESARRGAAVVGTDLDPAALDATRANCAAAGVAADLRQADARTEAPDGITAIVTNPPLGSRVKLDAGALLVDCLPSFQRVLAPGGRLVWITPAPRKTTPVAERLGLRRSRAIDVDLGGVRGAIERWDKPR